MYSPLSIYYTPSMEDISFGYTAAVMLAVALSYIFDPK